MANLLLDRAAPQGAHGAATYSLLFDMNVVFERYVGQLLRHVVCPPEAEARLQVQSESLLLYQGKPRFNLRPDAEIRRCGERVCLVDTKWKRLASTLPHHGVSQADVYQAYAYGKEYLCPRVVLLYPQDSGQQPLRVEYQHRPGLAECARLTVATVDVAQSPMAVAAQLRGLL